MQLWSAFHRRLQKQFEGRGEDTLLEQQFSFGKLEYCATDKESLLTVNGINGSTWTVRAESEMVGIFILVFDSRTNELVAELKY